MAAGGMYDQVGGGFHRYSVDAYWLVPHFEKMLYDQALLAARVPARLAGHRLSRATGASSRRPSSYVLRDLRHADGGFFSAEDADSEGIEGKFYLWSLEEIEELLRRRRPRGDPLLRRHRRRQLRGPAHRLPRQHPARRSTAPRTGPTSVAASLPALFAAREQRVRPGLDDKVLLGVERAVPALARRGRGRASAATTGWTRPRTNARFLLARAAPRRRPAPALVAGRARRNLLAYAEDYAALLEALLTLAEVDDVAWLAEARDVADEPRRPVRRRRAAAALFTTGADAEALIVRPKDFQDNATPSENSLAADGLLRLAALTGDAALRGTRASQWIGALAPVLGEHPTAFAYLLGALERARHAADRGRDRRRRRATRPPTRSGRGHWRRVAPGVGAGHRARPGVGADLTPLLADRDARRRAADGVRVRALRLSSCPSPTRRRSAPSSTPDADPDAELGATGRTS